MEMRDLKYFEAVARHKKFVTAAEELHISQPALSNTIKRLEQEIGYKLFERSTKKLSLTESGQAFNKHVYNLLSQFDNTINELKYIETVGGGKLKIGMIESFGHIMPQIINQFKHVYPKVGVQILEMSPATIESSLKNYDIHLGITSNIKTDQELQHIPIIQENLSLATPVNHKFKDLNSVDMIDLKDETLIHSLSGFGIRKIIVDACNDVGFEPKIQYETESLDMASNLVEIGLGVSVMPESYLKSNLMKKINIVRLKKYIPKRTIFISYHSQRYLPTAFHDFISMIEQFAENNIGESPNI